jgi:hypothetical protein
VNETDRATQMILRTLALVGLGFWAFATIVYGIGDLLHGIQNVRSWRAASGRSGSVVFGWNFGLEMLTVLAWFTGILAGAAGVLLGAIQIALAKRGAAICAAFTLLGAGGIVGTFVYSQARNTSEDFAFHYLSRSVLGALVFPVVAVVVYAGAWFALKLPRSGTFVMTSIRVPSGSV